MIRLLIIKSHFYPLKKVFSPRITSIIMILLTFLLFKALLLSDTKIVPSLNILIRFKKIHEITKNDNMYFYYSSVK